MNQQEQTSTETVLIVNPNSCGGLTGKNWENLYNQIKEIFGENPEVAFSQKSGDGTTLTRDFLRRRFKKIVALGGDGTINEVANGFFEVITSGTTSSNDKTVPASPILKPINPEAMIGLIPSGSRNVLAKSLDLPDGIVECCQRFVNGKPQKIDVIAAVITTAEAPATARLLHLSEAKRKKNHFKGIFFFHFLNGSVAGIVFPYIVSVLIHSTNILSFSLLGLAYGVVLWILTLVPIHKPITGFSPWNHPLGHLPALASLSGHILYGIVLGLVVVLIK